MYALNADCSTLETTSATGSQRNRNFTSRRELEFQSALENYLSEYRLSMDAHKNRAGSTSSSPIQKLVEWYRSQLAINSENTSYLYNYGRQRRNGRH